MKVAYFDCQFGAAGDMLCASLLANGLDPELWIAELKKIAIPPGCFEIEVEDVIRCSISSKKMTVKCMDSPSHNNCHHDHHEVDQHDDGHEHKHDHAHDHHHESDQHGVDHERTQDHAQEHANVHDHSHEHAHPHAHDHGRSVKEIVRIIEHSSISSNAKNLSLAIFRNLAVAESRVHGVEPDDVHFHEVGAIDAIIDIVGFSIGYDLLGIEKSVVSPLTLGGGTVKTEHGIYPVPAPAVAYLVQNAGAPTGSVKINYECLTPTGAAILTTIAQTWGALPSFQKLDSVGYGAGTMNPKSHPNAVRMFVGHCDDTQQSGSQSFSSSSGSNAQTSTFVFDDNGTQFRAEVISVIEATIDDCPPNIIAYALEKALEEGALDIAIVPATMKKGRSGHLITVLAKPEDRRKIETLLLRETTTLGVRTYSVERLIAEREFAEVKLSDSWSIRIKIGRDMDGNVVNVQPEYADCATYADRHGMPLREVFAQALAQYASQSSQSAEQS